MENIKHCAIIVRRSADLWEGTRTSLGLAAHNYFATLYVIGVRIEMWDELQENLEWLEEMECEYISDLKENENYNFKTMSLDEISAALREMDIIIPFGRRE
jgi:hypothetical protein